jgi:serine/threonine-protein kinase HipA
MRTADIYLFDRFAGKLIEDDLGSFSFKYDAEYLQGEFPVVVSCTMPLKKEPYVSNSLFPFFDGLIPEGWLLDIAEKNWKLDGRDRMGLLWGLGLPCLYERNLENADGFFLPHGIFKCVN